MKHYYAVLEFGNRMFTMTLRFFNEMGQENTVYAAVESHGIVNMIIDNNPQVVSCIRQLCAILKNKTGIEVKEVYVSYIGGPITVENYECTVMCTAATANHSMASNDDIVKLQNSYRDYTSSQDLVVVDHLALQYKKDDQPSLFADLSGAYARNISCHFLLFLAERRYYERLEIALQDAKLILKGLYTGLRAAGTALINRDERAQALALLDDAHIELGFYENGVLTHYKWLLGGWDIIQKALLEENRSLRSADLGVKYLQTIDLSAFKPEWFERENHDEEILKKVGGHINAGYLVKVRDILTKEWQANMSLKFGGGLLLTGSISAIKGIDYFFNVSLKRKLPLEELYEVKVADHVKPDKWEACQPEYVNESLNLFSVPIGIIDWLCEQGIERSKSDPTVEQEKVVPETNADETMDKEESEEKVGFITRSINSISNFFKSWTGYDLSSYPNEDEDSPKK